VHVVHIVSGERTLSLRADSSTVLEHWIGALSSTGRAATVVRLEPEQTLLTPRSTTPEEPEARPSGRARQVTAAEKPAWQTPNKPIKVLLLGDAAVGKTSVLTRFSDGLFVSSTRATVGVDLKKSSVDLDGDGAQALHLQIWDTAGQEMFRSIIATYYRGAHGVMLMFDVTRAQTFEALPGWLEEVRTKAPEHAPVVLIGNKADCPGRAVSFEEADEWASRHGMCYLETSAKTSLRINDAFVTLVATAVGRSQEIDVLLQTAKVTQAGHSNASSAKSEVGVVSLGRTDSDLAGRKGCKC